MRLQPRLKKETPSYAQTFFFCFFFFLIGNEYPDFFLGECAQGTDSTDVLSVW
jgi:hypothetical protein